MIGEVMRRADEIQATHGLDVDEALARFEANGGARGSRQARWWLSAAFLLARRRRAASERSGA